MIINKCLLLKLFQILNVQNFLLNKNTIELQIIRIPVSQINKPIRQIRSVMIKKIIMKAVRINVLMLILILLTIIMPQINLPKIQLTIIRHASNLAMKLTKMSNQYHQLFSSKNNSSNYNSNRNASNNTSNNSNNYNNSNSNSKYCNSSLAEEANLMQRIAFQLQCTLTPKSKLFLLKILIINRTS